jgi:hypothetical protein
MFQIERFKKLLVLLSVLLFVISATAQKKKSRDKEALPPGKPVMWKPVNISQRDLFLGPGGAEMRPDLSQITFIKRETGGYNRKYRIKDGSGRVWIVKFGREAKPETAAVRLLWGLGYQTEINYWVPEITIPTVGTLRNVRLEARPDHIKRFDGWDWKRNPFTGTNEVQGLKIMMVFFNNWDVGAFNNKIFYDKTSGELRYGISDLGATFGKLGSNSLPIIWRLGRSIGKPNAYAKTHLVKGVRDGRVKLAYKGKLASIFNDITTEQARWLADLLLQLDDRQIEDAFRAANYSPAEIDILTHAVKNRIVELDNAASGARLGTVIEK